MRDLLDLSERPGLISFAAGLPAPELVPMATLQRLLAETLAEVGPDIMLHSPTEGLTALREAIAELVRSRGIDVRGRPTCWCSRARSRGSTWWRACCSSPGDVVVVEQPSFFGALQVFRAAQARLVGVPIDDDGMRPDALEAVLQRYRPKLIYTLPSFQNPSSALLSAARRQRVLELAYQYQVPILEDDPYSELAYEGSPPLPLRALDRGGQVLYLVHLLEAAASPGCGWAGSWRRRPMLRQLILAKQIVDLHSNTPGQWLLARFLRRRPLPAPRARACARPTARGATSSIAALREAAVPGLEWQRPAGGFYFWCRLPDGASPGRLLARAAEAGVSFLPGRACFVDDPDAAHVRLNFTYPPADRIAEGVSRFAAALRDVVERAQDRRPGAPPAPGRSCEAGGQEDDMATHFARRMEGLKASEIRELLKVTLNPETISFAGGLPAPELFPVRELAAGGAARARGRGVRGAAVLHHRGPHGAARA